MNTGNIKLSTILQIVGLDFFICLLYMLTTENSERLIYITIILRPLLVLCLQLIVYFALNYTSFRGYTELKSLFIGFPFYYLACIWTFNFMRNNFNSLIDNFGKTFIEVHSNWALIFYFTLPLVLSYFTIILIKIIISPAKN